MSGQELKNYDKAHLAKRLIPNHIIVKNYVDCGDISQFEYFLQTHNLVQL